MEPEDVQFLRLKRHKMEVEIIKKFALSEALLKCNAPQTSNDYSASNLTPGHASNLELAQWNAELIPPGRSDPQT